MPTLDERIEAPERIWIEEDSIPYYYQEDELPDAGSPVTEYIRADLVAAERGRLLDREAAAIACAEAAEAEVAAMRSEGSWFKESDIDRLMAERDAARAEVRKMAMELIGRDAGEEIMGDQLREARAEVERLSKPDQFWLACDPEYPLESWEHAVNSSFYEDVVEVMCAKELGNRWVAIVCLTVDQNGDPDETDQRLFDNPDDAQRCWPESLAAARAALAKEPGR